MNKSFTLAYNPTCPNCGGAMLGDGFTVPIHCERIDDLSGHEPDCDPIICTGNEEPTEDIGDPFGEPGAKL